LWKGCCSGGRGDGKKGEGGWKNRIGGEGGGTPLLALFS
jgi:hypothetical protein